MRGSIVRRGKSWAVVIDLPRDPQTKKRRQKWYTHTTQAEADRHLTQIKAALHGGTYQPPTKLTVAEYLPIWLRDAVEKAVGPVTLRDYRTIVNRHLLPAFGADLLATVAPQTIDRYLSEQQRAGLAPATVHKQYRILHAALEKAVRWGLLVRNPADMAKPPRTVTPEIQPWDEEEIRVFLGEAKRSSRHYPLYLTALLTGLRLGELLGLRWVDVDLPLSRLTVRQTFYRLGKRQLFKSPKSRASQRTVTLPRAVVEVLRSVADQQAEAKRVLGADYQEHDLVFCQADGKPLHAHNLTQKDFRRILRLEGLRKDLRGRGVAEKALPKPLRRIRFHDLRHCHASYLARAGVPVKVAQERLGHSTPALTLRIYTHTLAGQHEEAARAVEERLLGCLAE